MYNKQFTLNLILVNITVFHRTPVINFWMHLLIHRLHKWTYFWQRKDTWFKPRLLLIPNQFHNHMSHDKMANIDLNLLYGDNFFIFLHVFPLLEFYWLSNMMKNMWNFLLATLEAVFLWFQYAISSHNFSKKLIFKHWHHFEFSLIRSFYLCDCCRII